MSAESFWTLAGTGTAELHERGSRFFALAAPIPDEPAARALLAERERTLWDASHHCSARVTRDGIRRANDAGEPSGSAGAPILAAIEGAGLVDCVVVVSRYFGGSKLGVGGLIRAYGAAAAEAIRAAPRRMGTPAARLRVRYPYEHTAPVMRILEQVNAAGIEHGYAADGAHGEVRFALPLALEPLARESLRDATGGAVTGERIGEAVLYREVPLGDSLDAPVSRI